MPVSHLTLSPLFQIRHMVMPPVRRTLGYFSVGERSELYLGNSGVDIRMKESISNFNESENYDTME